MGARVAIQGAQVEPQSMVPWQCSPVGQSESCVQTQWCGQSTLPPHAPLAQSESLLHALPTGASPGPPHAPRPITIESA